MLSLCCDFNRKLTYLDYFRGLGQSCNGEDKTSKHRNQVGQTKVCTRLSVCASVLVITRVWARARNKHARATTTAKPTRFARDTHTKLHKTHTRAHKTRPKLTGIPKPNLKTNKNNKRIKNTPTRAEQHLALFDIHHQCI